MAKKVVKKAEKKSFSGIYIRIDKQVGKNLDTLSHYAETTEEAKAFITKHTV